MQQPPLFPRARPSFACILDLLELQTTQTNSTKHRSKDQTLPFEKEAWLLLRKEHHFDTEFAFETIEAGCQASEEVQPAEDTSEPQEGQEVSWRMGQTGES